MDREEVLPGRSAALHFKHNTISMSSEKLSKKNRRMYIQSQDLLSIHPSISKPSLVSSFWSVHVQAPPLERMDMDLKCVSQASLPDAFELKPNPLRSTKSMSDLQMDTDISERSGGVAQACVEDVPTQENLTNRVNNWLNESPIAKAAPKGIQ